MPKKRGVRLYIGRSGGRPRGRSRAIFDQEYQSRGPIRSRVSIKRSYKITMNVSDAIEWIRLSLLKEIAFALEDAMACIEDVGRLGGPNSPFAAYRFLPQVLQYVACMRDSFSAIIRGEDRGAKMLQTHESPTCMRRW